MNPGNAVNGTGVPPAWERDDSRTRPQNADPNGLYTDLGLPPPYWQSPPQGRPARGGESSEPPTPPFSALVQKAADVASARQQLLQGIAHHLGLAPAEWSHADIVLCLAPARLGRVRVHLSRREGRLVLRIFAGRPGTRALLAAQLNDLRKALAGLGLQLETAIEDDTPSPDPVPERNGPGPSPTDSGYVAWA